MTAAAIPRKKPPMHEAYRGMYLIGDQLQVDPKISTDLPLQNDSVRDLKDNILENGFLQAIVYWKNCPMKPWVIIDGHLRYSIAIAEGWPYPVIGVNAKGIDDARMLAFEMQATRRNMTPAQLAKARLRLMEQLRANDDGLSKANALRKVGKLLNVPESQLKEDRETSRALDKIHESIVDVIQEDKELKPLLIRKLAMLPADKQLEIVKKETTVIDGVKRLNNRGIEERVRSEIRSIGESRHTGDADATRPKWKQQIDFSIDRFSNLVSESNKHCSEPWFLSFAKDVKKLQGKWNKISGREVR